MATDFMGTNFNNPGELQGTSDMMAEDYGMDRLSLDDLTAESPLTELDMLLLQENHENPAADEELDPYSIGTWPTPEVGGNELPPGFEQPPEEFMSEPEGRSREDVAADMRDLLLQNAQERAGASEDFQRRLQERGMGGGGYFGQ